LTLDHNGFLICFGSHGDASDLDLYHTHNVCGVCFVLAIELLTIYQLSTIQNDSFLASSGDFLSPGSHGDGFHLGVNRAATEGFTNFENVPVDVCMYTYVYVYVVMCICVCIYMFTCISVCLRLCLCVLLCVCVCGGDDGREAAITYV